MTTSTLTPQQAFRRRAAGEAADPGAPAPVQRCVLAVRLENHTGALNRVANLFSQRGFNLDSVTVSPTVSPTGDATVSRMTIATSGPARQIEQVLSQMAALVDVLSVEDVTAAEHVERELCLARVRYAPETRAELVDLVALYRAAVVDVQPGALLVELTGPAARIDAFVAHMTRFGIDDVARSGRVAMALTSAA